MLGVGACHTFGTRAPKIGLHGLLPGTLTVRQIARATTLKCDDPVCGGDILYNTQEVWDGYLRSLAKQLDLDPNASDLINVIKRAGGGWCRDQPDTNVPSDP